MKNTAPAADPLSTGQAPRSRATLRQGADNNPVLVKLVHAKVSVTADGVFWPGTEAAVRAFQEENGLVADGVGWERDLGGDVGG